MVKQKPNQIDILGDRFCIPKGKRKRIDKEYPELKGKKLNIQDLPKVLNGKTKFTKPDRKGIFKSKSDIIIDG